MDKQLSSADQLARQKQQLLRQGEFYRVGIVHARESIKEGARPEALLHAAFDHATATMRSRLDGLLQPTGANFAMLAPFAMGALRFALKRRLFKPLLGVAAGLGAVAWYFQQRRQPH